jgi:hypothetical protein
MRSGNIICNFQQQDGEYMGRRCIVSGTTGAGTHRAETVCFAASVSSIGKHHSRCWDAWENGSRYALDVFLGGNDDYDGKLHFSIQNSVNAF